MAFIRKKSKGNSYYYELVESRREGAKVRQKVLKYFPSLKEAEEYVKSENMSIQINYNDWLDKDLKERLETKLNILNNQRPLSEESLKALKEKFEVDMSYHSNAIEGNRLTLRETWLVIKKGITISGKSLEEHLEATNHKEAIEFVEKLVKKKEIISEIDVLNLHALILDKINPQNAGFYRHSNVFIKGSELKLPKWRDVPVLMKDVYEELNNRDKEIKAICSAVKIHYNTVRIHPFIDGNGRLARLLMNLRLLKAGFPPVIIRKGERRAYYSALEKADKGDLRPLTMLIGKDVERALDLYIETFS
ncbi:MAG: Fic family protein [Candidatus Methanofastidiosa archaeon]|nr:Fic family protein [Candidatus Methanofastidiosa archaeon]